MLIEPAFIETELARRWNVSIKTLQRWRCDGLGPTYIKLSKAKPPTIPLDANHARFWKRTPTRHLVCPGFLWQNRQTLAIAIQQRQRLDDGKR